MNIIKSRLRIYDSLIRYGGDEFIAILEDTLPKESILIFEEIRNELLGIKESYTQDISFGFSNSAENGIENIDELIASADKNMYEMKQLKK